MNEIKLRKIEINSDFAHFKKPFSTTKHETYMTPPISTAVGILQNIFNENINNFVIGYAICHQGIFKDLQRLYKEINLKTNTEGKRYKNNIWKSDVCEIQYLIEPKLIIYTNLEEDMIINDVLNLGKTDCLAKVVRYEWVKLEKKSGDGYSQWTEIKVDGDGFPERTTVETKYNDKKGYYDIYTKLIKFNDSFSCEGYFDKEENQIIYLWNWRKEGKVSEFK